MHTSGENDDSTNQDMSPIQFQNTQRMQSEMDLAMARFRIEQKHLQNLQAGVGRKQKKSSIQIEALKMHFKRDPDWDYISKIEICEQLGMTLAQVQKWNWDNKKKLGMATSSRKLKKDEVNSN